MFVIKYFEIGKIINTHGLKGELKIFPMTDDIKRFDLLKSVFVNDLEYKINKVFYYKNLVYIKFAGVNNIDQAEKLKGEIIKIPESMALPLDKNEYYISDLYDLKVYNENEFLGNITDIISTGKHDVYVINKKIFIPAVKEFILDINIKNKTMHVKLIDGMRDLNA